MIVVGIDPGVNTGYAEWDADARVLLVVSSLSLHAAMWSVMALKKAGHLSHVVFEDARLRTWFGKHQTAKQDRDRLMGAGSVRRDSQIWAEFLADAGIQADALSPREKGAKYDAAQFARVTGWHARTNEHGRDAGMLCFHTKAKRRES